MNICIFTRTLLKGGAEKQSVLLANSLSKYHNVYLAVLHHSDANEYKNLLDSGKVNLVFLKGCMIKKIFILVKLMKHNKIEILFTYLFSTNLIGTLAGKISNVKWIIGGIRNAYHPLIKEYLLKIINNHLTDYTITNSYCSLNRLKKKDFNLSKIVFIPNGILINQNFIKRKAGNHISIITVARFVKQKDHFTALRAIKFLKENYLPMTGYSISYNLIGYGEDEEKIRSFIKENNLKRIVNIFNDDKKDTLLKSSDIYLSTSLFEGTSNSILEALNFSLPIVATEVGDNNYMVEDSKNGFLCKTGDYHEIARKISMLIFNGEQRNQMGQKSFELLNNKYSIQIFEENYTEFLNSLQKKNKIARIDSIHNAVTN